MRDYNWRNYTYKFLQLNGQGLRSQGGYLQDGQRSFSTRFDTAIGLDPGFFVIQLKWDAVTPFNFTDGTSVPTVSLLIFIRTSTQKSNPGGVLAADLCALSFCIQKRDVSVSLNQLSSTVLETVYGTKNTQSKPEREGYGTETDLDKGLSFIGDDFNVTFSEMPDGEISPTRWVVNLRHLLTIFEGDLAGTSGVSTVPKATSNFIGAVTLRPTSR